MILPGVSGSIIAVIFGVYDDIIFAIKNRNIKYLLKIGIGVVVGIILGANVLYKLFDKYYVHLCYLFIGLVLGTIPFLFSDLKSNLGKFNINSFLSSIAVFLLINILNINISKNGFKYVISGILFAIGKIIPGLSGTSLLMSINAYEVYIELFAKPITFVTNNFNIFIYILIGIITGSIVCYKIMNYLLENRYSETYSVIIGLTLISTIMMYPKKFDIVGVVLLIIGIFVSYILTKKMSKK